MITSNQLPALITVKLSRKDTPSFFVAYSLHDHFNLIDAAGDCICTLDEATLVCPNIDTLYPEALL